MTLRESETEALAQQLINYRNVIMKKLLSFVFAMILLVSTMPFSVSAADIYDNTEIKNAVVHDPSVIKSKDGRYYVVGSHLAMYSSDDLIDWTQLDSSLLGKSYLGDDWKKTLSEPLKWTSSYQNWVHSQDPTRYTDESFEYNCWANDIIYNESMGKYCLYGAVSVWGMTSSAIWLCVADNIEGPYEYVHTFIYSGITTHSASSPYYNGLPFTDTNIQTDLIDSGYITKRQAQNMPWFDVNGYYDCGLGKYPNAIDPTAYTDKNGDMWLVYGSYSGGCYVIPLVEETGLPDYNYMSNTAGYDIYFGKQISATNIGTEGTGEGPYIVYDKISNYYYLFLTYGGLAGNGGYNIREYRSRYPDGPFYDAQGNKATDLKNTGLKLDGNYQFSNQKSAYLSGGHSSCLIDDDGTMYQAYHTRYTADGGNGFKTVVHKMARTSNGWAVLLPYEYQGEEEASSVSKNDIVGVYDYIDSTNMTQRLEAGAELSSIVLPTQTISFNSNGSITGAKDYSCSVTNANTGSKSVSGTWSITNGTCNAVLKIGDVTYTGVFSPQYDESGNKTLVLTFSGAGDDNSTAWLSKQVNHNFEYYRTVAPTCTKSGYDTIKCTDCSAYYRTNYKSYLGHSYASKVVTKAPTYKSTGVFTSTCKRCGAKKTSSISKLANTSITGLTSLKCGFKISWKKQTSSTGYQIRYSRYSNMSKSKAYSVTKNSIYSKSITKLSANRKYYVQVRTYRVINGKRYYSAWSTKKAVTTKK